MARLPPMKCLQKLQINFGREYGIPRLEFGHGNAFLEHTGGYSYRVPVHLYRYMQCEIWNRLIYVQT